MLKKGVFLEHYQIKFQFSKTSVRSFSVKTMRGPSNLPGRTIHRRCSVKKMFLEISQNLQENACTRASFLINTLLKKRLWHRCFPVNFAKFLRRPFSQNTSGRLLLKNVSVTLKLHENRRK